MGRDEILYIYMNVLDTLSLSLFLRGPQTRINLHRRTMAGLRVLHRSYNVPVVRCWLGWLMIRLLDTPGALGPWHMLGLSYYVQQSVNARNEKAVQRRPHHKRIGPGHGLVMGYMGSKKRYRCKWYLRYMPIPGPSKGCPNGSL